MTKEELIAKLGSLTGDDKESEHAAADEWLSEFLECNGLADVAAAYRGAEERVGGWWYA